MNLINAPPSADRIVDLFFKSNDLTLLINEASRLLGNPVMVINTKYRILACSNLFDVDDDTWNDAIKRGYCSYEYAVLIRKVATATGKALTDFHETCENIKPYRRRRGVLVVGKDVVGYYSVLEINQLLESISEETYSLIENLLAKNVCIKEASQATIHYTGYESLLLELLHNQYSNNMLYYEKILNSDFVRLTKFWVAVINMDNSTPVNVYMDSLKSDLINLFQRAWTVYDKQYIVIIVDAEPYENIHDYCNSKLFLKFLNEHNFKAGVSDIFIDISFLPECYGQAKKALQFSELFNKKETIACYDYYKITEMLVSLPKENLITNFCSNHIQKILRYDETNNTQYLLTLYHYLKTGKSINLTANALFVHKNTVVYRISRIKELFNIDFDNSHDNIQMYLSCFMILYKDILKIIKNERFSELGRNNL